MEKMIHKKEIIGLPHGDKGPSKEEKTLYIKTKFQGTPPPWVTAMLAFPREKISHYTTEYYIMSTNTSLQKQSTTSCRGRGGGGGGALPF